MGKRIWSVLLGAALVASGLLAGPGRAQQPPPIPARANIEDPVGDANGLNDQGTGGEPGDQSGDVNIGAADLLKVWFTHTSTTISAHILTTFPPPNQTPGLGIVYRVQLNTSADRPSGCLWMQGIIPSRSYQGDQEASLIYRCRERDPSPGAITVYRLSDGRGITTLTYRRGIERAFAEGAVIAAPKATSRAITGIQGTPAVVIAPQFDNTKAGIDYFISARGFKAAPKKTPPGKNNPPGKGKKKGCSKGKGKKRGACPNKK